MEKTSVISDCSQAMDIDGYRERISAAVGLEVSELTSGTKGPEITMRRRFGAYILSRDNLPIGDIARILAESESFVRYSIDYVERRIYTYRALSLRVDQMAAGYALLSVRAGKQTSEAVTSGVAIESCRQRIASAVGLSVVELVAFERDNDAELTQKVASYLLLSREGLSIAGGAQVMLKDQEWVRDSKHYVQRQVSRDRDWKKYVDETTATYDVASKS